MTPSGISHSFDIGIAAQCGVHAALIYNHLCFWITGNIIAGTNYHEGRTWSYQTKKEIAAHFPYLTFEQVKLALEKLVKEKLVLTGHFHADKFKRDLWYAIPDESILKIETNSKKDFEKGKNPNATVEKPQTYTYNKHTDISLTEVIDKSIPSSRDIHALQEKIFVSSDLDGNDLKKGTLKMPQEKWDAYVAEYGESRVNRCATELSNYLVSHHCKYKSHYLALLNFIKRSVEREEHQKSKDQKDKKVDWKNPSGIGQASFRPKSIAERVAEEEEKERLKGKK